MVNESIPDRDASLGLIFRLNNLWASVDMVSVDGNYLKWNNLLDAIYRNLLHNEEMIPIVDKQGKKKLVLCESDVKSYKFFSIEVANAKKKYNLVHTKSEKNKAKSIWYHKLQEKDIWLRKFMQKQKLYLKQTEKRPGTAMYGTFKG